MTKFSLAFVLLSLLLVAAFGANQENAVSEEVELSEVTEKSYIPPPPPCPCYCYVDYERREARKECKKYIYSHCHVQKCTKTVDYHPKKGLECCDKPPPRPKCPCKCVKKRQAINQCRRKPHCKVTKCEDDHEPHHGGGYYRPRPKFQCCGDY